MSGGKKVVNVRNIMTKCHGLLHNKSHFFAHNFRFCVFAPSSTKHLRDSRQNVINIMSRERGVLFYHSVTFHSASRFMFESRLYTSATYSTNLDNNGGMQVKEFEDSDHSNGDPVEKEYEPFHQRQPDNNPSVSSQLDSESSQQKPNPLKREIMNASKISEMKIKYPLKGMGVAEPAFTEKYATSKLFLESLNIPTDELQFYPDIQEMSEDDILNCIKRLRDSQIHVIFSLFLIQRIFLELTLEKTVVREPIGPLKQWFKLRNGMYKLTSIRYVVLYFELCKLLEIPKLDPVAFLERLASIGIFDHLQTVVVKTRKLISVGAKPKDILDNLELYSGSNFNSKIKLYQNVLSDSNKKAFPIELFLKNSMTEFKNKLHVGDEVKEIAKLLDVKEIDFLMCWGFKDSHTRKLVYKIQMCLAIGISKSDIFNNVGILNRIKLDQCHRVTQSLSKSGQPGSVYVFKALEASLQHREANGVNLNEPDWTDESGDDSGSDRPVKASSGYKRKNKAPIRRSPHELVNRSVQSSKIWRMEVFKLISHMLHLDRAAHRRMFKADINIDPTQLTDITRNLDYLLSLRYTKEDIAQCPIVLAHPFENVVRVNRNLVKLLRESSLLIRSPSLPVTLSASLSSSSSSSPSSSLSLSSSSLSSRIMENSSHESNKNNSELEDSDAITISEENMLPSDLLVIPAYRLNVLQYYLEKETNFSLNYAQTQCVVEFLN